MVTVPLDLKAHILLDNNLAALRGIQVKGHHKEVHMVQDPKDQAHMDLRDLEEILTVDCSPRQLCCS